MKQMKLIVPMLFALIGLSMISSCTKEDDVYDGKNELFLSVQGENKIVETEDKVLNVKILLSKPLEKDSEFTFKLSSSTTDKEVITIVNNPITIKKGAKEASLSIKSLKKELLSKSHVFTIELDKSNNTDVMFHAPMKINVAPSPKAIPLTKEAEALLVKYKAKGFDISKCIGFMNVKVHIIYPGGGSDSFFANKEEKDIEGKTFVTISENASESKILLKMTNNAMGIEQYLYNIYRHETVLSEFWPLQPAPQVAMRLANYTKDSDETFTCTLNNIELQSDKSSVNILGTKTDSYGDELPVIPFDFTFTAWDRLKKLVEGKNLEAVEANKQGGTLDPQAFLNYSRIDSDDWGTGIWKKTSATYDMSTGKMKFTFCMDHASAGDYIIFEVECSPVK